ncbi:MAG: sodium-dependent transporter [Candidatus Thermoplasmatota archaeon]
MGLREHWNTRFAFIMAAVGSAVGLGNLWRFPYICYKNGGGAFLIPFFTAIFTAGIPLLILEFTLGHMTQEAPPQAFKKIGKKWEWTGWWTSLIPFMVAIYYVVIMSWCFSYMIFSIKLRWMPNATQFFKTFIGDTGTPTILVGINLPVLLGLIAVWSTVFLILYKGVKRIGKVVALTVPIPTILLILLTVRGLTLQGALEGINYYLTPNFGALLDINVWLSAYAQVFFSFSLAQGIMITYSSYLRKKSDINGNAFIIAFADAGTSFLAGFTVFSVVGYLASIKGISITTLGEQIAGPNLTFITYPTAISLLPVAAEFFGIIFFIALLTFGIDSAFSMIEPINAGINKKWRISKTKTTAIICIIGFTISTIFATGGGFYLLEILDTYVANFGLVSIGLIECLILGWIYPIKKMTAHANKTSDLKIGKWWEILVKYIIPTILIILLFSSAIERVTTTLTYPWWITILAGVLPLSVVIFLSFPLMKSKTKKQS